MSRREDVHLFVTRFADGTGLCDFTGHALSDVPPNEHCCDSHADIFEHHRGIFTRRDLPFTRHAVTPGGLIGL